MQSRLIRTHRGEYVPAAWNGKNESGMEPWDDRVLVLTDEFATITSGGIHTTDNTKEHMDMAATTGVLVALGPNAWKWNSDRTRPFEGKRPEPGQRVYFEQYAGSFYVGDDDRMYRSMDDKCIGGGFTRKPKVAAVAKVTRPKLLVPA